MDDPLDRSEVEVIELDEDMGDPYAPEKLVGVALAGALGSILVYYLFHQLESDKRRQVKDGVVSLVKKQLARLGEAEDD